MKERNTYERGCAFYDGRKLTLNAFKVGIFSIKETKGEGIRMLTPKQMLQRWPVALAQIKAGNTSENLLNEIRQIIFFVSSKRNY